MNNNLKYSTNCWVSCPKCEFQLEGLPIEDSEGNELDMLDKGYIPSHYCIGLKDTEGFFIKEDE